MRALLYQDKRYYSEFMEERKRVKRENGPQSIFKLPEQICKPRAWIRYLIYVRIYPAWIGIFLLLG